MSKDLHEMLEEGEKAKSLLLRLSKCSKSSVKSSKGNWTTYNVPTRLSDEILQLVKEIGEE